MYYVYFVRFRAESPAAKSESGTGVLFSTPVSSAQNSEEIRKKAARFNIPDGDLHKSSLVSSKYISRSLK